MQFGSINLPFFGLTYKGQSGPGAQVDLSRAGNFGGFAPAAQNDGTFLNAGVPVGTVQPGTPEYVSATRGIPGDAAGLGNK